MPYYLGEYPFHEHDTTDDYFYVLESDMEMDIEGEPPRTIKAGELFVVPKGVVHRLILKVAYRPSAVHS